MNYSSMVQQIVWLLMPLITYYIFMSGLCRM